MRLRTARKIYKSIGSHREACYSIRQRADAIRRVDRTREMRDAERLWGRMLADFGADGCAKVLSSVGEPGMAFRLLMREGGG